jgi:hypothetical protein
MAEGAIVRGGYARGQLPETFTLPIPRPAARPKAAAGDAVTALCDLSE